MHKVHRSALLPYTPAQMYALVTDVRSYPEFLPWCTSSDILADDGDEVTVKLGLSAEMSARVSRRGTRWCQTAR